MSESTVVYTNEQLTQMSASQFEKKERAISDENLSVNSVEFNPFPQTVWTSKSQVGIGSAPR